jgi:hypothetical protein
MVTRAKAAHWAKSLITSIHPAVQLFEFHQAPYAVCVKPLLQFWPDHPSKTEQTALLYGAGSTYQHDGNAVTNGKGQLRLIRNQFLITRIISQD